MVKLIPKNKKGNWIKGAVNPKHKGYCTPMTKSTCTPRRKAFAKTMKKHHGFHKEEGGEIEMTKVGGIGPRKVTVEKHGGLILLGQMGLVAGQQPKIVKEFTALSQTADYKDKVDMDARNKRAAQISGRADFSPVNIEDALILPALGVNMLRKTLAKKAAERMAASVANAGKVGSRLIQHPKALKQIAQAEALTNRAHGQLGANILATTIDAAPSGNTGKYLQSVYKYGGKL